MTIVRFQAAQQTGVIRAKARDSDLALEKSAGVSPRTPSSQRWPPRAYGALPGSTGVDHGCLADIDPQFKNAEVRQYRSTCCIHHDRRMPIYAGVPTSCKPDIRSFRRRRLATLSAGRYSLQALPVVKFPTEIGPDMFPRVCEWVQFFHMYRDHLPGLPAQFENVLCLDFMMFAGTFAEHPQAHALILSTFGGFMVATAWSSATRHVDSQKREIAFGDKRSFLVDEKIGEPGRLAEPIDGAVGTLIHLHFMSVHFLFELLDFVTLVDPTLCDGSTWRAPRRVWTRTPSQNFVGALSNAVCVVNATAGPHASLAVPQAFVILVILLSTNPSYRRIPEALLSNLLHLHLLSWRRQDDSYRNILHRWDPVSTYLYPVVSWLSTDLADVMELIENPSFKACEISERQDQIQALCRLLELLLLLEALPSSQVGVLPSSLYRAVKLARIAGGDNDLQLTKRERTLLRAVVHRDYLISGPRVCPKQLGLMNAFPGEPFLTLYDYTTGPVKATIQLAHSDATKQRLHGRKWADVLARAAQSAGCMWADGIVMPGEEAVSGDTDAHQYVRGL
ncbi:hypothetical protein DFH09DRAFT_1106003 [Mycena vulgaris]|nr:hypothetical protein DFH09DRAFT_1106003 [Mycena vulgaris]